MIHVFISWSGRLSEQLAAVIRDWLPDALQFVKPYFSPNDIEKGARWEAMLSEELAKSSVGIFVMTVENLNSKWLHFEAGAISKSIDRAHVCTVLFEVEPTDIEGPLSGFQATRFVEHDIRRLFMTINSAGGESKLPDANAARVFDMWWPELEKKLTDVLRDHKSERTTDVRSERQLIEEILLRVRSLSMEHALPHTPAPDPNIAPYIRLSDFIGMGGGARSWVPVDIELQNENAREVEIEKEDILLTLKGIQDVKIAHQDDVQIDRIRILVRAAQLQDITARIRSEHRDVKMHINVGDTSSR